MGRENIERMLIVLGFITMVIGLLVAAYGMLITKPETGMAKEVFWGTVAGILGFFLMILGGYKKD